MTMAVRFGGRRVPPSEASRPLASSSILPEKGGPNVMSRMVMKRAVLLSVVALIGVLFVVPGSAAAAARQGDANAGCRVTSRTTHAHFTIRNGTSPLDAAIAAAP